MSDLVRQFAYRLRQAREAQRISQHTLAHRLKISQKNLSDYERGIRLPRLPMVDALARELHVTAEYLVGDTDTIYDDQMLHIVAMLSHLPRCQRDYIYKIVARMSATHSDVRFYQGQSGRDEQQIMRQSLYMHLAHLDKLSGLELLAQIAVIIITAQQINRVDYQVEELLLQALAHSKRVTNRP